MKDEKFELNFTKDHVLIAKAVAIILMFIHHLFAFPDRTIGNEYSSLIQYNGKNIEVYIGIFGKICVAIYLFLSGYGMAIVNKKKNFKINDSINRLRILYINYWIVFILFIPIGFIFYGKTLEIKEFILNFIGMNSSYNGEWWFFRVYVLLILTLPITKKIISKDFFKSFFRILGIYSIYIIINLGFKSFPNLIYIKNTYLFSMILLFLANQASFFMGYLAFEFDLFKLIKLKLINLNLDNKIIHLTLALIVFIIRFISRLPLDFLLAPIFIFAITNLFYKNKVIIPLFNILGKHSTNMWLVHSFFCYTYFQNIIFYPKNSILILIFLIILTVITSVIIEVILNKITNINMDKKFNIQLKKQSRI